MNITKILSDSFRYPFSNIKRLLILGILMATSILIIPSILALGYTLRIMEHSFKGSNELPPFGDWINMFIDGIKYAVVNIVYIAIPAMITGFISIAILLILRAYGQITTINALINFIPVVVILGIIIMVYPYFLSLIALPHLVKKNKIEAGFNFKEIIAVIKKIGWLKYISGAVLLTALTIAVSAISSAPQILHMGQLAVYGTSALVGFFIASYLTAFKGRFLALLYEEGIEEQDDS